MHVHSHIQRDVYNLGLILSQNAKKKSEGPLYYRGIVGTWITKRDTGLRVYNQKHSYAGTLEAVNYSNRPV